MLYDVEFISIQAFFGTFSKAKYPLFEILGSMIMLQIYPYLSEFMDEPGDMFLLTLHLLGLGLILFIFHWFIIRCWEMISAYCPRDIIFIVQ